MQHRLQLGQHRLHLGRAADGDEHDRHVDVGAEEPGAAALSVHGAVHPEEHRRPGEPVPVQQIADRVVGGRAVDAAPSPDVEGQLDRVAAVGQVAAEQSGALQGDQAAGRHLDDVVDQCADRRRGVDGGDRDRRVLGQRQRLVAADHVARAEAGDAAQHHTAGHLAVGVEVQHRLGEEA